MRVGLLLGVFLAFGIAAFGQDQVTITFWTHEDPNRTPLEERFIAEFTEMHPHVSIERVTYPSGQMVEVLLSAFAARRGPTIFNLHIEEAYPYLEARRVAPLGDPTWVGYESVEDIVANYVVGTLEPVYRDGQLYGLPLEVTNWLPFVNERVFRDAGLDPDLDMPTTWEEMMAVSEHIAVYDGEILVRRGLDFRYPYYLVWFLPMVEQMGGALDYEEGIVNDDAWLHVLEFMRQWGRHGKNLGSPAYTGARRLWNFDRNEIAMCLTGMYQIDRVRHDNLEFYESGEWRIIPFPVFDDAVHDYAGNYYAHYYKVNAEATPEQQEWAWRFIGYMLRDPEIYLAEVGLVQPTHALMASETYAQVPYGEVFEADLERGKMVPLHPGNSLFQAAIGTAIDAVMVEGATPERALERLKADVREIIEDYR